MPVGKDEATQAPDVKLETDLRVPIDLPRSIDFSYSKSAFLQKLVLQTIIVMLIIVLLSSFFLDVKPVYSAIILTLIGIYVVVSTISPFLTSHSLTPEELILRQGWYFKTTIPVKDIESVNTTDEPSKVGVKFSITYRKIFVAGSKFGLVNIKLKEPRRFALALGKVADEVIIDVDDRQRFIDLLKSFIEQRDAPILASPIQWS
jgi:hypothetical protein